MSVHALPLWAGTLAVHEESDPVAAWIVVSVLVLGATLPAALRVAAVDERLVVRRLGRTARVCGPGPSLIVPVLERAARVSLRPRQVGPVWVAARTADAVTAHVAVAAQVQIVDPALAAAEGSTCRAATALEESVSAEVARTDVAALAGHREALSQAVAEGSAAAAAAAGTRLASVEVLEIKLDLDAHLVAWADRGAGAREAR